jgi:hypothetical protein
MDGRRRQESQDTSERDGNQSLQEEGKADANPYGKWTPTRRKQYRGECGLVRKLGNKDQRKGGEKELKVVHAREIVHARSADSSLLSSSSAVFAFLICGQNRPGFWFF